MEDMKQQTAVIIGGGLGGLAIACMLGKSGYRVIVLEKNEQLGGRAGQLKALGFTFDTGPSWYLMPDVFEHFFALMGERLEDHLQLTRLSPGYRVFYKGGGGRLDIASDLKADMATFEHIEPGAGAQLQRYLAHAQRTYETALRHFTYKNYDGAAGLLGGPFIRGLRDIPVLATMQQHVARYFRDPRLQKLLLYPSVFLGVSPYQASAMYSMLSHADFTQGVHYPMGGTYAISNTLAAIGKKYGVAYRLNTPAERIIVENGQATGVVTGGRCIPADIVISDAGVHHTETALLQPEYRDHTDAYWQKRMLAPSALLLYLGVNRQYDALAHHNLVFSNNWRRNFDEIYKLPQLPSDPSLYVCAPSKTDPGVAPKGKENLFVLVPVAAGLKYTTAELDAFTAGILETIERELHLPGLRRAIIYQKAFCVPHFAERFNSPYGTALGLAHTLRQTAMFRPRNISRKVSGLYYVGADVHPGIGMPSVLISAELAYKRLIADRSGTPLSSL